MSDLHRFLLSQCLCMIHGHHYLRLTICPDLSWVTKDITCLAKLIAVIDRMLEMDVSVLVSGDEVHTWALMHVIFCGSIFSALSMVVVEKCSLVRRLPLCV